MEVIKDDGVQDVPMGVAIASEEPAWDPEVEWMCRPDKRDRYMVKSMKQYGPMSIREGDVVLDLGGNIGAFAKHAFERGAQKVISFEPEPGNFRVLQSNKEHFDRLEMEGRGVQASEEGEELPRVWEIFDRAIVGPDGPREAILHTNGGKNQGCHSLSPIQFQNDGSGLVRVRTAKLEAIVDYYRPSVIKCDIEGAEYEVLLRGGTAGDVGVGEGGGTQRSPYVFPDFVRSLAVEVHLHHRSVWRKEYARELADAIDKQGFGVLQDICITEINWYSLGIWIR